MNTPELALPIVLTTLLILLLLSGVAIAFFVVSRQKQQQKAALTQARLAFENEVSQVELELREELIGHFSRELHDNLGHQIACLRLSLENLKLDHPVLIGSFTQVEEHISAASEQVRLLSRSLNGEYIFGLELKQALQLEIERYEDLAKFKIIWQYQGGSTRLDKAQTLIVFRMFQEIMTNVFRHSQAEEVIVELNEREGFQLIVKDDGCGFDLQKILTSSKSFGIRNIKKRADLLELDCQINTTLGEGCQYVFTKTGLLSNNGS